MWKTIAIWVLSKLIKRIAGMNPAEIEAAVRVVNKAVDISKKLDETQEAELIRHNLNDAVKMAKILTEVLKF